VSDGHGLLIIGRVALFMVDRQRYPSDVTDAQWALIGPFLNAWRATRVSVAGRLGGQDLREIVNAILYQGRTGCQWAYLPHDLPQKPVTYYYFALWRDDGTDAAIHDLLRCQAREKAGRAEDPSAVAVDTQSIRPRTTCPRSRPARTPANGCPAANEAWPWTRSV
jgi:transposase